MLELTGWYLFFPLLGNTVLGERVGEGFEGGADGRGEAGTGRGLGGLNAENDDLIGAVGQVGRQLADGAGMGAKTASRDRSGIKAAKCAGGGAHVRGIEQNQPVWVQAANQAGEVLGGGGRVDTVPIRMTKSAGKDGPEGIVAVS